MKTREEIWSQQPGQLMCSNHVTTTVDSPGHLRHLHVAYSCPCEPLCILRHTSPACLEVKLGVVLGDVWKQRHACAIFTRQSRCCGSPETTRCSTRSCHWILNVRSLLNFDSTLPNTDSNSLNVCGECSVAPYPHETSFSKPWSSFPAKLIASLVMMRGARSKRREYECCLNQRAMSSW